MREFDLDLLIGKKVAVNCKTEDEAKEFLKYLDSKNIKWNSNTEIFKPTCYRYYEFKENTCFSLAIKLLQYSPLDYYKNMNYKIISLNDLVTKPKNNFKDYGFEADFEGHIYERDRTYLLGKIRFDYDIKLFRWDYKTGICRENENYNLKPIKKEWYENPDNFPCIIKQINCVDDVILDGDFLILRNINDYHKYGGDYRFPTEKEILKLLVKE